MSSVIAFEEVTASKLRNIDTRIDTTQAAAPDNITQRVQLPRI